jgi:peptide/nickel transport system substrate-binding protein
MAVSVNRLAAAAAIVAALAIVGCGSAGSDAGSVLRIGDDASRIDTLNPIAQSNVFSAASLRMTYPYLVQYDASGHVVGDFAKTFSVSSDGTTYTFKTYPDAKWSDGQPLTANDAAWTIQTILKFSKGSAAKLAGFVDVVSSVSAPDANTVVVKYAKPNASALFGLANVTILPEHVWKQYATGNGAQLATFANTKQVGAGPFALTRYAQNQLALFGPSKANYGPKPHLSGFGFQFYSSPDAMVDALNAGQLDVGLEVPPTAVATVRKNKNLTVHIVTGTDTVLLGINSASDRTAHPELRNPQVREAIDMAMNRTHDVSVAADGYGTPVGSIIPPSIKQWADPTLTPPTYDPAKADQILDKLGFTKGSDGVRRANGHPMSYSLYTSATVTGVPRILDLITADLKAIGIKITAHRSDFPSYDKAIFGPDGKYHGFDFSLDDYLALYDPSSQLALVTCDQRGGTNESGYCDPAYDALYEQQNSETGAARVVTVKKMQEKIATDRPLLPLYTAAAISATRKGVNVDVSSPLVVNFESKTWLTQATK